MLILTCLHLLNMSSDSRGALIRAKDVHLKCLLSPFPGIDWLPCLSDRGKGEELTAQGIRSSAPHRAAISNRGLFCLSNVIQMLAVGGEAEGHPWRRCSASLGLPSQFLPNVRRLDLLMILVLIAFSIGVLKDSNLRWTL